MIYSDELSDYLKMAQEYVNQLNEDLIDLKAMVASPKVYLLESFTAFKNNIDIIAQNLVMEHKSESESLRKDIFETQSSIIKQVEEFESETFKSLASVPFNEVLVNKANEYIVRIDSNLTRIKNEINQTTDINSDLDLLIDTTELILNKISLELNKILFSNRTIVFIEKKRFKKKFDTKKLTIGKLVIIQDEYISKQSINNIVFESYDDINKYTQSSENLKCIVLESRLQDECISLNNCIVRINLNLNKVNHAKLSNLYLESLDVDTFQAFNNLSSINLSFNRIKQLDKSVFTGLERKLIEIDISRNNHLKKLISFEDFKNLSILNLSFIQISVVEKDTFRGLANLKVLHLSHNYSLTKLELNVFEGLFKLVELDLSFNELNEIDVNLFKDLENLKMLSLEANDLKSLNENTLKYLTKLEVLKLSSNLFKSLPATLLYGLHNLNFIDISNNSIKFLDHSFFKESRNLTTILLADNKLTRIGSLFNNILNLQVIDIAFNHLKNIDIEAFKGMSKLKILKLNDNKLRHLSLKLFDGIYELNELTLSNNQFKELDPNIFKLMKVLKLLNLFGNPLDPEIYLNVSSYFNLEDSVQVNWEQIHTN